MQFELFETSVPVAAVVSGMLARPRTFVKNDAWTA